MKTETKKISTDEKIDLIIKEISNYYNIKTSSEAIRLAVNFSIFHHEVCNITPKYTAFTKNIMDRVNKIYNKKESTQSFRISTDLLKQAQNIYPTSNSKDKTGITFAISCCLLETHEHIGYAKSKLPLSSLEPIKQTERLFYRPGVKSGHILRKITNSTEELRKRYDCDTFIEPFAGLANVTLHLNTKFKEELLNDGEYDNINLLFVIQTRITILSSILSCLPVNKEIYDLLKKKLKSINCVPILGDIDKAAIYYYINFLSAKGTGLYFNETFTEETLLQGLTSLAKISKRLQNAIITQEDIFIFLKKILRQKGSLEKVIIYLDPPYLGTEDYYKAFNSKDEKFHEKLKELIIKLKKRGAKIILSYRATVTSSNSYTTSEKVQKKLDKLYMNRGFFIQSQKVTNNQIEILLTSEQVEGSIPYDCKIATLI